MASSGHNAREGEPGLTMFRRIVIAPDSFKGSLSAAQAAAAMEGGVRSALPDATTLLRPVSDGGEGMVEVVGGLLDAEMRRMEVCGPLPGQRVEASWAYCKDRRLAVMEMAEAAGLGLVPAGLRDPKRTTTYGVGQMIREALDCGAAEILIGIGGSATNDGGAGMALALGARFLDAENAPIPEGGAGLCLLEKIDLADFDRRIGGTKIVVACDVTNPLTGPEGAAAVYAPQKGASAEDVKVLEKGLERLAGVLEGLLGIDIRQRPGSGAAGGLGGGLIGFCGAILKPGIEIVLDLTGFDESVRGADLVLTGEGKLDSQLKYGKALAGVLRRAKSAGVPVAGVAGIIEGREDFLKQGEFVGLASLVGTGISTEEAMSNAGALVRQRTGELLRSLMT